MRYARFLGNGEEDKWLEVEMTLGSDQDWIDGEAAKLASFFKSFSPQQAAALKNATGLSDQDVSAFVVHNRLTVIALLVKIFIEQIGTHIINEADPSIGAEVIEIYTNLAERVIQNGRYPTEIYIHYIYRRRGTPKTWLTLGDGNDADAVASLLKQKIKSIVHYVNLRSKLDRRYRTAADVDGNLIFVISKYTKPRVITSLRKNIAVAAASHTFIVFNRERMQIGVVSGAHKEVGHIHTYLRYKLFPSKLAPRRNEEMVNSQTIVSQLIETPDPDDGLVLKGLEIRNANLHNSPTLKLASQNDESVYPAADEIRQLWQNTEVSDLKNLDYIYDHRNISLYSRPDPWERIILNTRSGRIRNDVENRFLSRITDRLGGIDIKTTRLILRTYSQTYILNKLIGQKSIAIDTAIPKQADEVLVQLIAKKIVDRPPSTTLRRCFSCWNKTWLDMPCSVCGSEDLRIVGEYMSLQLNEKQLMKLTLSTHFNQNGRLIGNVKKRQRSKLTKDLIAISSPSDKGTVFMVYVGDKKDVDFVLDLADEGFGIVAVIDPKTESARDKFGSLNIGCIGLIELVDSILTPPGGMPDFLKTAIRQQQEMTLQRIISRAVNSMQRLRQKATGYGERAFEVDLTNTMQLLVPDIVRLGTEHSGQHVPDGYLKYGLTAYSRVRKGRLFGWDAKYSQSGGYSLSAGDLKKQKDYIDWLSDTSGVPAQFGSLGIYAIISNFTRRNQFETVMNGLADYTTLPARARIVVIEDMLIVRIAEWIQAHWEQVLVNNSAVSKVIFSFFRRRTAGKYTVSSQDDWQILERQLNRIIQ